MSPIISFKNFNKNLSLNNNLSPTPIEISADVDQLIKSLHSIGYGTKNSRGNQVSQLRPKEVSKPMMVRTANLRPMPSGVVTGGVIPRDCEFVTTSKSERVNGQPASSYNLRPRARDKSRNGIDPTSDQRGHPPAKVKAAVTKKRAGKTASKRKKP